MQSSPSRRPRRASSGAKLSAARRRRRLLIPIAILAVVVIALSLFGGSGGGGRSGSPQAGAPVKTVLLARAAPTPLPAPISGESVVATRGGPLIAGGLDSSSNSVSGVFQLDSEGGNLREVGSLTAPLHDAAATLLGEQVLVFGGGSEVSTDGVQALPAPAGVLSAGTSAKQIGTLPTARSDLSAVTVGGRAYVLGGYDGKTPIDSVLATQDGSSFTQVARLPVPARYLAVAALGGRIYAFGGLTASGASSDAIREIDPRGASARLVGRLPQALSHASALAIGGSIYVLGGDLGGSPSDRIWRYEPGQRTAVPAGRLPQPIAGAGAAVIGSTGYLIGGTGPGETPLRTVLTLRTERSKAKVAKPVAKSAAAARPPFSGRLLIADRGNDRLLLVNAQKHVLWRFPSRAHPAPPGGFYFPDDAFFIHHGAGIISNEEQNERIVQLSFPSGKLLWSYGHPGVTGSEPGYLHEPDDAYLLKNGTVTVADAQNCRVLLISEAKKVLKSIGSPASCSHEPPQSLGSPNGDTPLRNGNFLISEVTGSYIDEITPQGKLLWSLHLPIAYPSDPQQLAPNRYLVADYSRPGGIYEFNRAGKIFWSYHPAAGKRMLNHPSLAERLPNGLIAANDDYRARVVIIDPRTGKIVWQFGRTGEPGAGPSHLRLPDGFDLLAPNGTTPTHPNTG